ncbi:hypothetical protein ACFLSH_01120 [Bacteroidota bacterium]
MSCSRKRASSIQKYNKFPLSSEGMSSAVGMTNRDFISVKDVLA